MKFITIAVLLVAVTSTYAFDDIAEKEKQVAADIQKSANALRLAENNLKYKQAQLRGSNGKKGGPPGKADDVAVVDTDEVKIMNGVPLKPHCDPVKCPRAFQAWKGAMKKYDEEQALDYVADPVTIVNGIPMHPKCKLDEGDEHAKKRCEKMQRAFVQAEVEYEKKAFAHGHGADGSNGGPGGQGPGDRGGQKGPGGPGGPPRGKKGGK